jgi:hypothetical protein
MARFFQSDRVRYIHADRVAPDKSIPSIDFRMFHFEGSTMKGLFNG